MHFADTTTIRELAVDIPGATRVFEQLKIDYCCGGSRTLADACVAADADREEVERLLEQALSARTHTDSATDFTTTTLSSLIDHIVNTHHRFTRQEVDRLCALADKVALVHSENHPELTDVKHLVHDLRNDLRPHMLKEERVLFPYVIDMETALSRKLIPTPPPFGVVQNPVRMMMAEHDAAGDLLSKLRQTTNDYALPADACFSYQTLFHALEEFERDLHQHIHLENNILFPRAVAMETEAWATYQH